MQRGGPLPLPARASSPLLLLLLGLGLLVAGVNAWVLPAASSPRAAQQQQQLQGRQSPRLPPSSRSRLSLLRMSAASVPSPSSVTRAVVQLPTGLAMEVLSAGPTTAAAPSSSSSPKPQQNPLDAFLSGLFGRSSASGGSGGANAQTKTKRPPLVFVHGSFHSAWCWAEHFLPFFAAQGYPCYAISCRGTSQSPDPDPATKAVKIRQHAADLRAFLDAQFGAGKGQQAPVVIGHSFGGAILSKMLEVDPRNVRAGVWLCSVPPSGNGPMTSRFLKRDFILALKIVLGFVAKKGAEWGWLCRELFFDAALDNPTLERYKARLRADSVVGIDVKDFLAELPTLQADPATGRGAWVGAVPRRLVVGAEQDKLVDREGVEEMAEFADAGAPVFLPLAHDVMLVSEWRTAAQALLDWLGQD